ncbi:MAG TPA: methyltransferase domain-containing protein [Mycobacteriales bacterium]|jgi:SAM-dependent methyltransferase|nr:methyltransferase domain-containing protein [Mycobacteriales bacterium]
MSGVLFGAEAVPEAYQRHLVPALFVPWAALLIDRAEVLEAAAVLDVASGTGVVALAALDRVGARGRVVSSDVSPAMLAFVAAAEPNIETLLAPADDLGVAGQFDVVLCQQGLQFMSDPVAAVSSMQRALRPSGILALSVWARGQVLEPFDVYGQVLEAEGLSEPFPGAYSYDFCRSPEEIVGVLEAAGLTEIDVTVETLEIHWPSIETVVSGIAGTPYGPPVAALPADRQRQVAERLRERLRVSHPSVAVVGRGVVRQGERHITFA